MTDLTPHKYRGLTFHVAPGLSPAKADNYCQELLWDAEHRKGRTGVPAMVKSRSRSVPSMTLEELLPSDDPFWNDTVQGSIEDLPARKTRKSQTVSKQKLYSNDKTPKVTSPDALGGHTEALETTLYDSGHYRNPCRVCGLGIIRTGSRGRAPVKHPTC